MDCTMDSLKSSSNTDSASISNNSHNSSTETAGKKISSIFEQHIPMEGSQHGSTEKNDICRNIRKPEVPEVPLRPNIIDSKVSFNIDKFMNDLDIPITETDASKRFYLLEERLANLKFIFAHYRARHDQLNLLNQYLNNEQNISMETIGKKQKEIQKRLKEIEELKEEIIKQEEEVDIQFKEKINSQEELNQKLKESELYRQLFVGTDEKYKKMMDERMDINVKLKQAREHTLEIARERAQLKLKYEETGGSKNIIQFNQKIEEKSMLEQQLSTLISEEIQINKDSKRLSKQNEKLSEKLRVILDPSKGSSFPSIFKAFAKKTSPVHNIVSNSHNSSVENAIASETTHSTDLTSNSDNEVNTV